MSRRRGHWTEQLFVEKPYLFLPFLTAKKREGVKEAAAIAKLFKEHGLKKGDRILDLCCGIGRIAVPLAKHGYNVVGVDISPDYVKRAQRYAASKQAVRRTKFIVGDYRDIDAAISKEENFHGILNTFTSIGYYGKEVDKEAFLHLAKRTVRGGIFMLRTINCDWILRHFERKGWEMAGNVLVLEERRFDSARSYMVNQWEYYRVVGPHIRPEGAFTVDHRIYDPRELKELMESAGWKVASVAASYTGDPIDVRVPDRSEIVIVGRRR